jgi:hypothetical protein
LDTRSLSISWGGHPLAGHIVCYNKRIRMPESAGIMAIKGIMD